MWKGYIVSSRMDYHKTQYLMCVAHSASVFQHAGCLLPWAGIKMSNQLQLGSPAKRSCVCPWTLISLSLTDLRDSSSISPQLITTCSNSHYVLQESRVQSRQSLKSDNTIPFITQGTKMAARPPVLLISGLEQRQRWIHWVGEYQGQPWITDKWGFKKKSLQGSKGFF